MQLRIAGFGANQLVHTTDIEELTQHLPIRIEFVEVSAQVDQLLPTLYDMVSDGLSEVQDTMVVKAAIKERNTEPKLPHAKQHGKAKLMRIYLGEADPWKGEPLYEAIVKQLRRLEISGPRSIVALWVTAPRATPTSRVSGIFRAIVRVSASVTIISSVTASSACLPRTRADRSEAATSSLDNRSLKSCPTSCARYLSSLSTNP